ncbi:MAG: hypothetical protein WBD31_18615 [Rubripirellula sp.]
MARGISAAVLLACVGYVLPFVLLLGFTALRYGQHPFPDGTITKIIDSHKQMTLHDLKHFGPNLGCLLLFGLSGLVNFTPAQFPGLIRTMIRIGGAAIAGVVLMGIATMIFGLTTNSYTEDPHAPTRFAIFATVPIGCAVILLSRNANPAPKESDEP